MLRSNVPFRGATTWFSRLPACPEKSPLVRPLDIHYSTLTYGHVGKFNVAIRGFTVNDEDLVCLDLTVDFRPLHHLW